MKVSKNRLLRESLVKSIAQEINASQGIFVIDFKGISSPSLVSLRKDFVPLGAQVVVVKNTLLRIAKKGTMLDVCPDFIKNQVALVCMKQKDVFQVAKKLQSFLAGGLGDGCFKAGVIGEKSCDRKEFCKMAEIASVDSLYARLCGQLKSPITSLVLLLKQIGENK
jgi:large subunit ribosomal protein L10